MQVRMSIMKLLFALSGLLLIVAPTSAFAHENVGGDELAAANWMLIAAFVVGLMGLGAGYWAWRSGQFSNVEESKYRMLDLADDYDAVMAEADAQEKAAKETDAQEKAAPSNSTVRKPGAADRPAHV